MKTDGIKTRFKNIYIGIAILWLGCSLCLFLIGSRLVQPKLLASKAQNIESFVNSHNEKLKVFDSRKLREELVNLNVIDSDRDFSLLTPSSDSNEIQNLYSKCKLLSENLCYADGFSLVFVERYGKLPLSAQSIIYLRTSYFSTSPELMLWNLLSVLILGGFAILLGITLSRHERLLLSEMDILSQTLGKIFKEFKIEGQASMTSFDQAPDKIKLFAEHYQHLYEEFKDKKEWLTNQNNRDALKNTLANAAHDLQGPILEGIEFCQSLPLQAKECSDSEFAALCLSMETKFQRVADDLDQKFTQKKSNLSSVSKLRRLYEQLRSQLKLKAGQKLYTIQNPALEDLKFSSQIENLDRVFWNLTKNAFEAEASEVTIEASKSETNLIVKVTDNGQGIPLDLKDKIFLEHFTTKRTGTGLGLSNVATTVKRLGGSIALSDTKVGSNFYIEIPLDSVLLKGGQDV